METQENKYEFIRGIPDLHDHRFRDTLSATKELIKKVVSLTESAARLELSRDVELKDLEECLGIMKNIQYTAKRFAGELFVLRNHLQGVEAKEHKKGSGNKVWRGSPNSIAGKSGFSPK